MAKENQVKSIHDLDKSILIKILDSTFMNIFVTDPTGRIIFASESSARVLGVPRDEILNMTSQSLLEKGILNRSTNLEALSSGKPVMGNQITSAGYHLFSISRQIYDEQGNLILMMTNSHEDHFMTKFFSVIENEKRAAQNYKDAVNYYMERSGYKKKLIINSPAMRDLMKQIQPVIPTDCTVLLCGESGTGKDVLSNYIHVNSNRTTEPFIPVNCAAIPGELVESEFFGYEKGAFTGASNNGKAGFFEIADKGTLFLDEIGELPLAIQSKLLRVLESRVINRVGSEKHVSVDIRIIAATNRNLQEMVEQKTFREDLFYRLNVIPFTIPPLRERPEDIMPLAQNFLNDYNEKYNMHKFFDKDIEHHFLNHHWKGNIRELKNIVERLSIMSDTDIINSHSLHLIGFSTASETRPHGSTVSEGKNSSRSAIIANYKLAEKEKVFQALLSANGNKTKAAKALGISKSKLYKILNE